MIYFCCFTFIKEIESLINNYIKNTDKSRLINEVSKLKKGSSSIQVEIYELIYDVLEGKNINKVSTNWPNLKNKLDEIYVTFPIYVGKLINLEFAVKIENYKKYSDLERKFIDNL